MTAANTREEAADLIAAFAMASGILGDRIAIRNALPHFTTRFGPGEYLTSLRNLGVDLEETFAARREIRKADCPCFFLSDHRPATAIFDVDGECCLAQEAGEAQPRWGATPPGEGAIIRMASRHAADAALDRFDFLRLARGFGATIVTLLAISLLTNLAALAAPLLVITIYDRVIPAASVDTIIALCVAALVAVILDLSLRIIRGQAVAHMGGEVERELGVALFSKLAKLPVLQLRRSSVHEQIARLRQFESLRDIFSGPLFLSCLDLPFVLIFVAVLFYLSTPIGYLLLGVAALFAIAAFVSLSVQRRFNEAASAAKTAHQSLLFEITSKVSDIQRLGAEGYWSDQLALMTETAAHHSKRAKRAQLIAQALGQTLIMGAGVGTIAFGAMTAIQGDMTLGALIALITLVWRVLGPIQSLYSSVVQIQSYVSSARQIQQVLDLEEEFTRESAERRSKSLSGRIEVTNVTHRYLAGQEPVLASVNLSIEPGQLVVFCGISGSGRSTLFNLINRLYKPTAGAIYFDDVDYRQIAVDDLRGSITMERQHPEFFHGTILQNFELANPLVTQAQIEIVLDALGLWSDIRAMPEGLNTRLDEAFQKGMSTSVAKGLGLARALLRDTNIFLFDNPCAELDADREHRFLTCIKAMRGGRTVLMTSDRPSHWEMADHLVFFDRGRVAVNEPRATALPKIRALYSRAKA